MKLMRCAVYIRVSSEEQAKYGDSMRDQKERGIERHAAHPYGLRHPFTVEGPRVLFKNPLNRNKKKIEDDKSPIFIVDHRFSA